MSIDSFNVEQQFWQDEDFSQDHIPITKKQKISLADSNEIALDHFLQFSPLSTDQNLAFPKIEVLRAEQDGDSIAMTKSIVSKFLKKSPEILNEIGASMFEYIVKTAFDELQIIQNTSNEFPSLVESFDMTLIALSKNSGYMIHNSKIAVGGFKNFYKAVKITDQKVSARADLEIKDPAKFKSQGLKIDPIDFSSEYIIPKSEFVMETNDRIICIKPLYDGNAIKEASDKNWNFDQRLEVMHQSLLGLKDLHDHGYIHRDIKPGNILVKTKKDKKTQVSQIKAVLGDEDGILKKDDPLRFTHPLFTVGFICSDTLNNPSAASDMYAFGNSLNLMLENLGATDSSQLTESEKKLKSLIEALTHCDPQKRPTAAEALVVFESIRPL